MRKLLLGEGLPGDEHFAAAIFWMAAVYLGGYGLIFGESWWGGLAVGAVLGGIGWAIFRYDRWRDRHDSERLTYVVSVLATIALVAASGGLVYWLL